MPTLHFLDPDVVEARYRPLLRAGASLKGAVAAPQHLRHYDEEMLPARLAGRLLWSVTRAHALVDGNKRASIELADEWLALNGHRLEGDEDALYHLAYDAAAGEVSEEETVYRLRWLIQSGAPAAPFAARYPNVLERLAQ